MKILIALIIVSFIILNALNAHKEYIAGNYKKAIMNAFIAGVELGILLMLLVIQFTTNN